MSANPIAIDSDNIVAVTIGDTTIISTYLSPNQAVAPELDKLRHLLSGYSKTAIGADFNYRWSPFTNLR